MDEKILKTIKKQLETERQRLEKELGGIAGKDQRIVDEYHAKFPQYGTDEGENAAEVAAYGDQLSMERTLEKQLRDVSKALRNIANGTYGICQYCKNPIEEKRLLARPTSSSCVSCKKKLKGE